MASSHTDSDQFSAPKLHPSCPTFSTTLVSLSAPCQSETFNRRSVYLFNSPIFTLFMFGARVSQDDAALNFVDSLQKFVAAHELASRPRVAAIWSCYRRVVPMATYYSLPSLESVVRGARPLLPCLRKIVTLIPASA